MYTCYSSTGSIAIPCLSGSTDKPTNALVLIEPIHSRMVNSEGPQKRSTRWERTRPSTNPPIRQGLNERTSKLSDVSSFRFANGDQRNEESVGHARGRVLQNKSKNGRYIFVTAHTPAVKYATELCEVLRKTNKTTCPSLFRDPDRLLSSQ